MTLQDNPSGQDVPLLQLSGIGKQFGETEVLSAVDLSIYAGDFVAIVGPSGAGKSTLLNVLGLLDRPNTGHYFIKGEDTQQTSERERDQLRSVTFGFVFQSSNILAEESCAQNAALGLRIQGNPQAHQIAGVSRALAAFGLLRKANTKGKFLSGGERQRLALARALATDPEVILADEPTGNLDSSNSQRVIADLQRLHSLGRTVIVITHDETVAQAAERRIHIRDGHLTESTPRRLETQIADSVSDASQHGHRQRPSAKWRKFLHSILAGLNTITGKPARALMLVLAFLIGTGGLVASIGTSQSASNQVADRLSEAALDEIILSMPPELEAQHAVPGVAADIKELDGVVDVGRRVGFDKASSPITRFLPGTVNGQAQHTGVAFGADEHLMSLYGATTSPSTAASLLERPTGSPVALIGQRVAKDLNIAIAGPGMKLWVAGRPVDVVGTIDGYGREPALENAVVLSPSFAQSLPSPQPNWIVRTEPGYPAPLAEALPVHLAPDQPGSVHTQTVADLRSLRIGVASDMATLVAIVSLLLLVLATISAGTSMYLSVQARRAEIALRRAIGASRNSIRLTFLSEGLFVGLLGGSAGAASGLGALICICSLQHWTPVLDPNLIWISTAVGAATGMLSAIYPAYVAARASPADAIRG